jgi:hypothetical protein
MGLEGIVSKRKDLTYRSGRSSDWLKMKNPACEAVKREAEEDCFVGCRPLRKNRHRLSRRTRLTPARNSMRPIARPAMACAWTARVRIPLRYYGSAIGLLGLVGLAQVLRLLLVSRYSSARAFAGAAKKKGAYLCWLSHRGKGEVSTVRITVPTDPQWRQPHAHEPRFPSGLRHRHHARSYGGKFYAC